MGYSQQTEQAADERYSMVEIRKSEPDAAEIVQ